MNTKALPLVLAATTAAVVASAQTNFFWRGNDNALWSAAASWSNELSGSGAPLAGGSNDYVIVLGREGTFRMRMDRALAREVGDTNFWLNALVLEAGSYHIFPRVAGNATGLVFIANSYGGLPSVIQNSDGDHTISLRVVFSNDTTFAGTGAGAITLSNIVSGAGALIKNSAGPLILLGNNAYEGGTLLQSGVLAIGNTNALGTGPLTMSTGTTLSNAANLATTRLGVTNAIILSSGTATFHTAGNLFLSGQITGDGGFTKLGANTLILSNANNNYTGATIVKEGVLRLATTPTAALGSGNLVLNGGILELAGGNLSRAPGDGANQIQISGESGFSAIAAGRTVTFGSASSVVTWGSDYFNPDVLILNNITGNSTLTFANSLDLNGADRAINVNSTNLSAHFAVIARDITNSAGTTASLIKGGPGTLRLDGTNTYDGSTIVTGGVLRIGNATLTSLALPSGNLVLSNGAIEINYGLAYGEFARSLGAGTNQVFLAPGSISGFSSFGAPSTINLGGDSHMIQWGVEMDPAALLLNAASANAVLRFANDIDLNGADRQINVEAVTAPARISGIITNTGATPAGLIKDGAGTLRVVGDNFRYDGPTIINGGELQLGDYRYENGLLPGAISNMATVYFANPYAQTVTNLLSGTGVFTMQGNGDVTFIGSNSAFRGTLTIYNGTLFLDHSPAIAPASDIGGLGSALVLQGGTLTMIGSADANATNSQTFRSWTLNSGWSRIIADGTSSAFVDLTISNVTRAANNGGVVDFTLSNASITTTQAANFGIIGGFATIHKSDWATVDENNRIVPFSDYLDPGNIIPNDNTAHIRLSGNVADLDANVTAINTLSGLNNGTNYTVALNGKTLRLGVFGGLLNPVGAGALTIGTSPNDGILTAGTNVNNAGEIILLNYSGNLLTINSSLTNNGTGMLTVTIAGGPVLLNGNNSFRGAFRLIGGSDVTLSENSVTRLEAGALTILRASLTVSGELFSAAGNEYVGWTYGDVGTLTLAGAGLYQRTNASGGLYLGNQIGSMGVLNIQDNAVFSNRYRTYVGHYGTGIVHQTGGTYYNRDITYLGNTGRGFTPGPGSIGRYFLHGGTFTNVGALIVGNQGHGAFHQFNGTAVVQGELQLGAGYGGYGYYELSGGSLENAGTVRVGMQGAGIFYLLGGVQNITSANGMRVGEGLGGSSVVFAQSGVLTNFGPISLGYAPGVTRSEFTVSGDASIVLVDRVLQMNRIADCLTTNIINLNGGVLQVNAVTVGASGGFNLLNFNGGTLQANTGTSTFLEGLDAVYIFSGGANIHDGGNIITINQALLAPSGSGVTNIPWSGDISGYIGAPYVALEGGSGTGATAVALFDYTSNSVTGIVITSSGSGYAPGDIVTVTLTDGGNTNYQVGTALLGAIADDGGLTKSGAGILILTATNTYGGNTIVQEGLLDLVHKVPNAGNLSVSPGAGLILGVGSDSQWSTADASNAIAQLMSPNSSFGLDTTLAPNPFAYEYDLGGFSNFYKLGANTLIVSGTNTYTGNTYVLGGALRAEWGVGLPTNNIHAGNLVLSGGVWETSSGIASNWGTGFGQFQLASGAAGFSAVETPLTVNLGGNGDAVVWGTDTFNPDVLVLNDLTANTNLIFVNPIDLNNVTRTVSVRASDATIVGDIYGGGGLSKLGAGTLTLAGNVAITNGVVNLYEGAVNITGKTDWLLTNAATIAWTVHSNAALNISGVFSNAGRLYVGNAGGSTAVVNQTDGHVALNSRDYGLALGITAPSATGSYNLYGGDLVVSNRLTIGLSSDTVGIFNMTNGTLTTVSGLLEVGRQSGTAARTTSYFIQSGGIVSVATLTMGRNNNDSPQQLMHLIISNGVFTATAFNYLAPGSTGQTAYIYLGNGADVSLPAFPTGRGVDSFAEIVFDGATLSAGGIRSNYMGRIDAAYLGNGGLNFIIGAGTNVGIEQVLQDLPGHSGVLRKSGEGLLILSNDNTYTGGTFLQDGTLQLGLGGAAGSILDTYLDLATASSFLAFNRSDTVTNWMTITGNGGLVQKGPGTLVIVNTNTFTGEILIEGGFLLFASTNVFRVSGNSLLLAGGGLGVMDMTNLNANLLPLLAKDSPGMIGLTHAARGENFDFNADNWTNLILGAGAGVVTNAGYTPFQQDDINYYRLGAAQDAVFVFTNITDASGSVEINKNGLGGSVVLTPINAHTNGTTVFAGILGVAHQRSLGTGVLTMHGGSALSNTVAINAITNLINLTSGRVAFMTAEDLTVRGAISGSGGLDKYGTGILTLVSTGNWFTGGTVLYEGGIAINLTNSLGRTARLTMFDGTLLSNTTAIVAPAGMQNAMTLVSGVATMSVGPDLWISGAIAMTGQLYKAGAGMLTLSGNNTGTGGVYVAEGGLGIGHVNALGNGVLTLTDGTSLSNRVALSTGVANAILLESGTVTMNIAYPLLLSGDITENSTATLVKSGYGELYLSGNNTFSGGLFINTGGVQFNNTNALPASGVITLNGGGVALDVADLASNLLPRLALNPVGLLALFPVNANEDFDFNTPNYANLALGAASDLIYGGTYTPYQQDGTNYYRLGAFTGVTLTFTNPISGNAALEINKGQFTGTVALANTNNTFHGGAVLNGGTVIVGAINDTGPSSIGYGATLSVTSNTIIQLTGAGNHATSRSISNTGALHFDITNPSANLTLSGNIGGEGGISKSGAGTLTLAGTMVITNAVAGVGYSWIYEGALDLTGNITWTGTNNNLDAWYVRSNAVLNISGTLDIGRLRVGNGAETTGTVNQTDGLVVLDGDFGVMLGNSGANAGVYNLFGGTLSNANRLVLGLEVGSGAIFHMTNGFLYTGTLEVGRRDIRYRSSTNYFIQSGGEVLAANLYVGSTTNQLSYLIISNGVFTATAFTHFGHHTNAEAHIYLGPGAVVSLPNFPATKGTNSVADITFDGGTLIAGHIAGANAPNYFGLIDNVYLTANGVSFVVGAGTNVFISHVMRETSAAATLRKFGNGMLVLSNDTMHTGGNVVYQGVLAFGGNVSSHVTVHTNATAGFVLPDLQTFLATQVTAFAESSIALTAFNQNENIDFNTLHFTNTFLGAVGNVLYGGHYTPFDDTYRFGGGVGTLTYTAPIAGSSNVLIGGGQPITVVFTATNTYTGPTLLNQGTLSVASLADEHGNIPTNGVLHFNGGALQYTGAGDTTTRIMTNTGGAIIDVADGAATLVLHTDVAGEGGFAKSGPGTLTFGVAQHFHGGLTVNGGFLQLASGDNPIPSDNFIIIAGGILDIGGGTQHTTNAVTFTGGLTQNGTIHSANLPYDAQGGTVSAILDGPVGLLKTGSGTFSLTGPNTFAGDTVILGGILAIAHADALGAGASLITNAAVLQFDNALSMAVNKTMIMIQGTNLVPVVGDGSIWNGAMLLAADTTNTFNVAASDLGGFAVNGVISGDGALLKLGNGILQLAGTNAFTGGTRINAGTLSVSTIQAIDSGTLAFGGGILQYTGPGETSSLTITNITASTYDIANPAAILTLHGDVLRAQGLTKVGLGTLIFSNTLLPATSVTVRDGWLLFQDAILAASGNIDVGNLGGSTGTLVFAGSTTATNLADMRLRLGAASGSTGVLLFTNDASFAGSGTIQLGSVGDSMGLLFMAGGSLSITGLLYVGNANNGAGAIYQSDGHIQSYETRIGQTAGGYGYYQFSGGTAQISNWTRIAAAGIGILDINGGHYSNNNSAVGLLMGGAANATGVLYQTGGTLILSELRVGNTAGALTELNLAGGETIIDGNLVLAQAAGTNIVNLLSGSTLQVNQIIRQATGRRSFFNFDGGILRAAADDVVLMGDGPGGRITAVYVFGGGAVIDTDGHNVEITQNLLAPTGKGVTSVIFGDPLNGYMGAPYVAISGGGGTGATAVALFDAGSGSVTGIVITSRGVNFNAEPDVLLRGGGQSDVSLAATIGENTSGGLTKVGAGTLLLSGTNTYAGYTRIEAGTLALNYGTILTNSAGFHVLSGAALDAQAYAPPLSSQSGLTLWPHQVLKGAGTVLGDVNLGNAVGLGGGSISPGDSIGTLTIDGSLDLGEGGGSVLLVYELQSPSHSDRIVISNGLSFTSMSTNWFHFIAGGDLEVGNYVLMRALWGYGWSTLDEYGDYGGTNFDMIGASGKSGYLWLNENGTDVMLTVVPEPGTGVLVVTGVLLLFFLRRRK